MAPAVPGVERQQRRPAAVLYRSGRGIEDAGLDERGVVREAGRAVRGDASTVGGDEDIRDVGRDVGRGAERFDEPRRPGLEEIDPNGEAVNRIRVDRHGPGSSGRGRDDWW